MILPSKKVLSIFIVIVALVTAIIITFGKDKSSEVINYTSDLVVGEKVEIPENPNWQGELIGIVKEVTPIKTEIASTTAGETTTDVISKSLMANYLALKQAGTLTQESAQRLVDQTASYVETSGSVSIGTPKLNIIPDNGKLSIATYGEDLGSIFKNNKSSEAKNELDIIKQAVESRDVSKINELDSIIAIYEKTANELAKMPVPKTFVKAHTDIVSGANAIVLALKEARAVFGDPLNGLTAIKLYQAGATTFMEAMQATIGFIKQNNIIYKQGSGGYYLLYGI